MGWRNEGRESTLRKIHKTQNVLTEFFTHFLGHILHKPLAFTHGNAGSTAESFSIFGLYKILDLNLFKLKITVLLHLASEISRGWKFVDNLTSSIPYRQNGKKCKIK